MQQIYTETAQIENVTFRRLRSRAGTQGMAARGQTRMADRDRPTGGFINDSRRLRQGRLLEIATETANDAVALRRRVFSAARPDQVNERA